MHGISGVQLRCSINSKQGTCACAVLRLVKMLLDAAECAAFIASFSARPLAPSSFASALSPLWYASVACESRPQVHVVVCATQMHPMMPVSHALAEHRKPWPSGC
jgi:hypothetical protein